MKSLVVEDDFISRMILQKILLQFGLCDVAANGKEAVQAFSLAMEEGEPYDLICLDIMMPEMDGKEALKLIRQKEKDLNVPPKNEVKIIMTTALDTAKDVIESYFKGGCTTYLVKPISKAKITSSVEDLGFSRN
jgi:two-component system, chemotaxis family, chemotaxis protein CheY